MARVYEGSDSGEGRCFGIVVSRFNEFATKPMLDGALNELRRSGVSEADIHVVWVPGAYEIPLAAQALAGRIRCDGLIAIGCIIRGETVQYEHIARSVADGLQALALEQSIPVGFGVITVENSEQAVDRAGGKHGNKGREAARSSLEMANLMRSLSAQTKREHLNRFIKDELKK